METKVLGKMVGNKLDQFKVIGGMFKSTESNSKISITMPMIDVDANKDILEKLDITFDKKGEEITLKGEKSSLKKYLNKTEGYSVDEMKSMFPDVVEKSTESIDNSEDNQADLKEIEKKSTRFSEDQWGDDVIHGGYWYPKWHTLEFEDDVNALDFDFDARVSKKAPVAILYWGDEYVYSEEFDSEEAFIEYCVSKGADESMDYPAMKDWAKNDTASESEDGVIIFELGVQYK